jgi:peptidoglycan/LPS O-acetylase OafA/YrhL
MWAGSDKLDAQLKLASIRGTPVATTDNLPALTSLRFFAAFAIVIEHARGVYLPQWLLEGWPLDNGVSFFYVLSGFILAYTTQKPAWRKDFYLRRIARIWPAHVATLLLFFVIVGEPTRWGGKDTLLVGLANLSLLHAWIPNYLVFFSYNSVSWSLSVEAFFYFMFPFIIVDFKRRFGLWLCASLLAVAALAAFANYIQAGQFTPDNYGPTIPALMYINPLARLFEFVLGMTAALLFIATSKSASKSAFLCTLIQGISIAAVFISWTYASTLVAMMLDMSPALGEWLAKGGVTCFSSAAIIYAFALGRGWLARAMSLGILVWLGEISFSLYLVHQLPITAYYVNGGAEWGVPPSLLTPGYLIFVFALAAAVHHCVERPARKWIVSSRLSSAAN